MERSDELRELMLRFYDAMGSGDTAFVDRHFSLDPDARAIGTDPREWWSGPRVVEVFKEQVENRSGTAFDGGTLEISTAEWRNALEEERIRNRKPAL